MLETTRRACPDGRCMEPNRLNPVTLIAGAASAFGAARARELARRSTGGLLLADSDENSLAAIADDLEAANIAPERVSTLAFDPADADRWSKASDFITAQYGRLDWAVVYAVELAPTDLVQFGRRDALDLDALALALRTIAALMRKSVQGGAIVIGAPASAIHTNVADVAEAEFVHFVRTAAENNAEAAVRINALAIGVADLPMWANAPSPSQLTRHAGDVRSAFDALAHARTPAARLGRDYDIAKLVAALLADECPLTGALLGVDAEQPM